MGFFTDLAIDAKKPPSVNAGAVQAAEPQAPAPEPVPRTAREAPGNTVRPAQEPAAPERDDELQMQQNEKKEAEQAQLARLASMSDQDVAAFSVQRVSADTERLTRRNMKECVSEHIQGICRENPGFARRVLHPRKTMVRCFQYIFRKAQEYAQQEMKDMGDNAESGIYALDIPDGLCFQWAEAYFKDPDAPEDQDKPKAVTEPVPGKAKVPVKKSSEKKSKAAIEGQISLLGEAG